MFDRKLLIATHNEGKIEEYKTFLSKASFEVVGLSDESIKEEAPESGNSYLEIAQNKAIFYSRYTKLPLLTDDSGLEIEALGGFPGIQSNRWLEGSDKVKNLAIIKRMKGVTNRKATFKIIIVYSIHSKMSMYTGEVHGLIAQNPEGVMGFGYDPIFYIPAAKRTMAQLTQFEKLEISHRGQALQKLFSYLKSYKPR